jgi:hypothetical protein
MKPKGKTHPLIDYFFSTIGCIQGGIFEVVRLFCDVCTPDEEIINSFLDGFNKGATTAEIMTISPKSSPKSYRPTNYKPTLKKRR